MSEFLEIDRRQSRNGPTRNEREQIEVRSAQAARDMAKNKALPLSNADRDNLKRLADKMEVEGTEY